MNINCIVWGINYASEMTGIAPYNTSLCEYLHSQGHEVRMVTSFPYYPEWRKRPGDTGTWFRTDVNNGIPVHRCWHYVPKKPSPFRRIIHELSFVVASWLRIMTLPSPDVYVVVSPPLLLGIAAWLASVFKWTPFVFHVQDLQPDAASSTGMLKNGLFLKLLYAAEAFAYRKADCVSGISPGMIRALQRKGVASNKTFLFPNGMELPQAESLPAPGDFRRRIGAADNDVLAVYSGNLGTKHGVEILLEAAGLITKAPIRIVICGDGAQRHTLERRAAELKLKNVTFLPLQPNREYAQMMAATDLYLVTQQAGAGSVFFPSKLLKGLALSKAIVVVADQESELSHAAKEGAFAEIVEPNHPKRLAQVLCGLAADPEKRKELGAAARRYAGQFEQGSLLRDFERRLQGVVAQSRPPFPGSPSPLGAGGEPVPPQLKQPASLI